MLPLAPPAEDDMYAMPREERSKAILQPIKIKHQLILRTDQVYISTGLHYFLRTGTIDNKNQISYGSNY